MLVAIILDSIVLDLLNPQRLSLEFQYHIVCTTLNICNFSFHISAIG